MNPWGSCGVLDQYFRYYMLGEEEGVTWLTKAIKSSGIPAISVLQEWVVSYYIESCLVSMDGWDFQEFHSSVYLDTVPTSHSFGK